jgi:hypothetical protein
MSMAEVKDVIAKCDRGAVVVLDKDTTVLTRVWALYEVREAGVKSDDVTEE